MIDVGGEQILDSDVPVQHPLGDRAVALINSGLSQIKKSPGHSQSGKQQPNRREEPPGKRLEGTVPVPNSRNWHDRQVNGVNPIQVLHQMQNKRPHPNTQHHHSQRQTHLQSDSHPSLGNINNKVPRREEDVLLVMAVVVVVLLLWVLMRIGILGAGLANPRQYQVFLQVQHIIHHPTQQNVYEPKAHQHKHTRKHLGQRRQWRYVPVPDCAHCDDAEVEGIDDGVGFCAGEVVPVEWVDDNSKAEIQEKQEGGLADDGAGLRLGLGNLASVCSAVSHDGHGWGSPASMERFPLWGCELSGGRLWVILEDERGGVWKGEIVVFNDGLELL